MQLLNANEDAELSIVGVSVIDVDVGDAAAGLLRVGIKCAHGTLALSTTKGLVCYACIIHVN
jgi:hypothetical protein